MPLTIAFGENELPIHTYGVDIDGDMYLANNRYQNYINDEIEQRINAINSANINFDNNKKRKKKTVCKTKTSPFRHGGKKRRRKTRTKRRRRKKRRRTRRKLG